MNLNLNQLQGDGQQISWQQSQGGQERTETKTYNPSLKRERVRKHRNREKERERESEKERRGGVERAWEREWVGREEEGKRGRVRGARKRVR